MDEPMGRDDEDLITNERWLSGRGIQRETIQVVLDGSRPESELTSPEMNLPAALPAGAESDCGAGGCCRRSPSSSWKMPHGSMDRAAEAEERE